MIKIWEQLGLTRDEWWKLAGAFYALAHNDFRRFNELPDHLKQTPAGVVCSEYIETGDSDLIDKAGYMITHTRQWYVYIGRIM